MRFLNVALFALVIAGSSLAACSSSSSAATNADADNAAAVANNAAAAPQTAGTSDSVAAANGAPVYPGATKTDKTSYGTPPPGATAYVTNDDPPTVAKWYQAKVSGIAVVAAVTAKGGLLLAGDQKTGTFVTLIGESGKTYILLTPAAAMSQ